MEPSRIIAAIIRLVSLQNAFGALFLCVSLPAHISMLGSSMSDQVKAVGRSGLYANAMNIGWRLMLAVILWVYAARIANFVLRTLEKNEKC